MGHTKALMEKVLVGKQHVEKQRNMFCASDMEMLWHLVVQSYHCCIAAPEGKSLTITDPNMTFLLSLDNSVDLVLYAFSYGRQGDIFVQNTSCNNIRSG